nr:MAG TPA: hypothetical protein [Caudoviricetes sp.]
MQRHFPRRAVYLLYDYLPAVLSHILRNCQFLIYMKNAHFFL